MKVKALAPWFGSNRMLASNVGNELLGKEWVGVVFAGGMAEVPYFTARTINVNDIHRHIINLAVVVALDAPLLAKELDSLPFHPDVLKVAQDFCTSIEVSKYYQMEATKLPGQLAHKWARNYFIACWMNRSALAGTEGEFKGTTSVRWNSGGGDSNVRYRSAIESLNEFSLHMRRCNFTTLDFREFLQKCKDQPKHGIYCDPPFPDLGGGYKYPFTEEDHCFLAKSLSGYSATKVVCRFYEHQLIRDLYPEPRWKWKTFTGRKQTNESAPEVLVTNQ